MEITEAMPGPAPQFPTHVVPTVEAAGAVAEKAAPPQSTPADCAAAAEHAPAAARSAEVERGWSADLVGPLGPTEHFDARTVTVRALTGVGLSALYGLALGSRDGGWALLTDALAVPMALIAVCIVGMPALFIAFAFLDAPIEPKGMAMVSARSLATAGLVLAGLAPAAALFIVTTEGRMAAVLIGSFGLLLGAAFGLRALLFDVVRTLSGARITTQLAAVVACLVFCAFAVLLSARVIESFGSLMSILALIEGAS
ncbi:MAG: hypothetical protein DRJ42_02795 [Deltaproteobacteria bacterium]|nr:MAG: hypothetical protein DRJ42_02795 [Deltaproteobacteria bacterium]